MKSVLFKISSSFVFFLLCFVFINQASANKLKSVRSWSLAKSARLVFDFTSTPKYNIFYLTKPDRLVIDMSSTKSHVNLHKLKHNGKLVNNIRQSHVAKKGVFRVVLDLNYACKASYFSLPPIKPYGYRLVIDLARKVATKEKPRKKTTEKTTLLAPIIGGRDVIIAVDAGHGGGDPGALGVYTYEKNITLKIAMALKERIDRQKGMHAFLTRRGDYYVDLSRRSKLAKKGKADFLVSIHADGFSTSRPRGASVWILSNKRATTEEVRRMQRHEIHSELLGGHSINQQHSSSENFLNSAFFDMSRSNSMEVGAKIGYLVLNELKKVTLLHKRKPVEASLAVLKSPYLPSILVEAGFITNPKEEKQLNKRSFQRRIAGAIFRGIYKHFLVYSPYDSLFSQQKHILKHTVRSGESLSIVAKRYGVSTSKLKSYNNLKSIHLKIGQKLNIPANYSLSVSKDQKQVAQNTQKKTIYQAPLAHKVRRGESLSIIAHKYNTNVALLKKYNKLRSTKLAIGQKIKIPASGVKPTVDFKLSSVHSVKRGESLSVIANRYGKTTKKLQTHNKLKSTKLAIGQKIKIPNGVVALNQPAPKKIRYTTVIYKVKRGESLSLIANRFGTSSRKLKKYNKLKSTSLVIGQKIKIPNVVSALTTSEDKKIVYKKVVHLVRRGESLSLIAYYYGKSLTELQKYNKLRSSKVLIGQRIKIPRMTSELIKYKVNSGESLSIIAKHYGVKPSSLKLFNHLKSNSLEIGQVLLIPVS